MMSGKSNHNFPWKRIFLHVSYWLFYVLFFGLIYGKYGNNYNWYFFESLCMLPFVMVATYATIYGILPFYLKSRKLLLSVVFVVLLIFVVTLGERIFLRKLNSLPITFDTLFGITFLYLMLETNFMVGIALAIKTIQKWLEEQRERHEIEKRNLETELNMLKSQLHPHFLFNTMNNLYALSLDEKSSKTSDGIAKISELLHSVLYECNEKEILISKEIELLLNYIELEKMRYDNSVNFTLDINGPTNEAKIAPMLLLTFTENCFKHSDIRQNESHYIKMVIDVSKDKFDFYAENNKALKKESDDKKVGIGLSNVRKRLELIYPEKYKLNITDLETKFIVRLSIDY